MAYRIKKLKDFSGTIWYQPEYTASERRWSAIGNAGVSFQAAKTAILTHWRAANYPIEVGLIGASVSKDGNTVLIDAKDLDGTEL